MALTAPTTNRVRSTACCVLSGIAVCKSGIADGVRETGLDAHAHVRLGRWREEGGCCVWRRGSACGCGVGLCASRECGSASKAASAITACIRMLRAALLTRWPTPLSFSERAFAQRHAACWGYRCAPLTLLVPVPALVDVLGLWHQRHQRPTVIDPLHAVCSPGLQPVSRVLRIG